jgi:hypothetical protein
VVVSVFFTFGVIFFFGCIFNGFFAFFFGFGASSSSFSSGADPSNFSALTSIS